MELLKPTVENHVLFAIHNMPCAVCQSRTAVLQMNTGVFLPCWECQSEWELRRVPWWRRIFNRTRSTPA